MKLTAVRIFTVLYDGWSADNYLNSMSATGIPNMGDAFSETWSALICKRKRAIPLGRTGIIYQVICEYDGQDSPLSEDPEKSWRNQINQEEVDYDVDGDPIENAAGTPITGVRRPFYDKIYTFTRNEATSALCASATYAGVLNDATVTLDGVACAAGQLLLHDISGERVVLTGSTYYWRVTYTLMRRTDGWRHRCLNKGPRYWTGLTISGQKQMAQFATQGVHTCEGNLAADGQQLAVGASPVWLYFDIYPTVSFTPLSLS
jgi:hypothetical protein